MYFFYGSFVDCQNWAFEEDPAGILIIGKMLNGLFDVNWIGDGRFVTFILSITKG